MTALETRVLIKWLAFISFLSLGCGHTYRSLPQYSGYEVESYRGRLTNSDFIHSFRASGIADYHKAPFGPTTYRCNYIDFTSGQDTILHDFFLTVRKWSVDTGGKFRGKYMFVVEAKNKKFMAKGEFKGISNNDNSLYFELPVVLDTNLDSSGTKPPLTTTLIFSGTSYKYNYKELPPKKGEITIWNNIAQNSFAIGTLEDKNKVLIPIGQLVISGIEWRAPEWLRMAKDSVINK